MILKNHTRVVNINTPPWNRDPETISCSPQSALRSPFSTKRADRPLVVCPSDEEATMRYAWWLTGEEHRQLAQSLRSETIELIPALIGQTLACVCDPKPCHCSVLAVMADLVRREASQERWLLKLRGRQLIWECLYKEHKQLCREAWEVLPRFLPPY